MPWASGFSGFFGFRGLGLRKDIRVPFGFYWILERCSRRFCLGLGFRA